MPSSIKRDWIELRLVDRHIDKGMLFIDVLAINLQIRNQVSLRRSIVCINGIRRGSRIDRATVGADIDEVSEVVLPRVAFLDSAASSKLYPPLRIPSAEHEASRACAFGKLRVFSAVWMMARFTSSESPSPRLVALQPRDALRYAASNSSKRPEPRQRMP